MKITSEWHRANFRMEDFEEVRKWCTEQFGPELLPSQTSGRWSHKFVTGILFRDEKDYIWFTLRWS